MPHTTSYKYIYIKKPNESERNRTEQKDQNNNENSKHSTLTQYDILLNLIAVQSENDDKIIRTEFDQTKSKRKKELIKHKTVSRTATYWNSCACNCLSLTVRISFHSTSFQCATDTNKCQCICLPLLLLLLLLASVASCNTPVDRPALHLSNKNTDFLCKHIFYELHFCWKFYPFNSLIRLPLNNCFRS